MSGDLPDFGSWTPPAEGHPEWDQEEADDFVGQLVLIGITYVGSDGQPTKPQVQYYGRIAKADKDRGIEVACEGTNAGKTITMPPVLRAFYPARPGQYRLRSTGETVDDPDLTTTWTVTEKAKS